MQHVCILTDKTAQYTRPDFPGHERVFVIPFDLQPASLPEDFTRPRRGPSQRVIPPSPQEFVSYYGRLSREYDAILVLTLSSMLNPTMEHALSALAQAGYHSTVKVVDSQSTAVGLGLLVQVAAQAASGGASLKEIEHYVRASIPRIFMLFCFPELTYLAHSGFTAYSQAWVGEMMGLLPIFVLEDGRLTPTGKVRTPRHLFESFQEFVGEFEDPEHIALMRGGNHTALGSRPMREFVRGAFPRTQFSEHTLSHPLAVLFGPQSIGLVVMDKMGLR